MKWTSMKLVVGFLVVSTVGCVDTPATGEITLELRGVTMPPAIRYAMIGTTTQLVPSDVTEVVAVIVGTEPTSGIYRDVYIVDVSARTILWNIETLDLTELHGLLGRFEAEVGPAPTDAKVAGTLTSTRPPPPPPGDPPGEELQVYEEWVAAQVVELAADVVAASYRAWGH